MGDIPLAVAPTVKTPGLALVVDLTAGAASPGSAPKKALLIAVKGSAGSITADTELKETVAGEAEVKTLLGGGTLGHLASKRLFEEYGLAQLDVVSPADPAGVAASQTVTFGGAVTADMTANVYIAGRKLSFVWKTGVAITDAGDLLAELVGSNSDDLPVTAVNAVGVVTLTFKQTGTEGNDCTLRVELVGGAGGTCVAGGAALAAGSGSTTIATALTTVVGKEYDYICLCSDNADAQDGTATSNCGRLDADMVARQTGFSAKLQQAIIGATSTYASLASGIDSLNGEETECVYCLNGESLPSEWAGAETGARLKAESNDPATNRIGTPYIAQLFGAADLSADEPTDPEVEAALNNGITMVTYQADGTPRPSRPITTYHTDGSGNPDDRVLDTSRVTGTFAVAKDLQVNLPREFEGAKLSPDIPPGEDEPPAGVVQEKDVKSFVNTRIQFWISKGVVRGDKYDEAVENGTFIVAVDSTDSSQLNIVLPVTIFPPLAKMSVVVQHKV